MKLADCAHMDYQVVAHMIQTDDFARGVTAKLVDKQQRTPAWAPPPPEALVQDMLETVRHKGHLGAQALPPIPHVPVPRPASVPRAPTLPTYREMAHVMRTRRDASLPVLRQEMVRLVGHKMGLEAHLLAFLDHAPAQD